MIPLKHLMVDFSQPTYEDLIRSTREKMGTGLLSDPNGNIVYSFPVLPAMGLNIDSTILRALGWTYEMLDETVVEYNTLTESFWTCNCQRNKVHHKVVIQCEKCADMWMEKNMSLPYIEDIVAKCFRWEYNVGR